MLLMEGILPPLESCALGVQVGIKQGQESVFTSLPDPSLQPTGFWSCWRGDPTGGPPTTAAAAAAVMLGSASRPGDEAVMGSLLTLEPTWAAKLSKRQDVAIKEMRCGHGVGILPDASLQRAMYEVKAGCGERRQSECLPTALRELSTGGVRCTIYPVKIEVLAGDE